MKNNNDYRLLTVQDISCVGQCSTTVALPIISAFGTECCILPTAVLSTHTAGFKNYTCLSLTDEFSAILKHWKSENIFFDCIYTGYLCGSEQIEIVKNLKRDFLSEGGKLIVDPVMADNGVFYKGFDQAFADEMRTLCQISDVIIPNITEACFLTGNTYIESGYDKAYIEKILFDLASFGVKKTILTGVSFEKDKLGIAVYDSESEEIFYYFNSRIDHNFHGTGDVYSSTVAGGISIGLSVEQSASLAVDFTVEAMKRSYDDRFTHWYGVRFEKAIPFLCEQIAKLNEFKDK